MENEILSAKDFSYYYEKNSLGDLYFPNGTCGLGEQFNISLKKLYNLSTDRTLNHEKLPAEEIIGIIAFGSAVEFPGFIERQKKYRKWLGLGPEVKKMVIENIQPRDADFMVLSEKPIEMENTEIGAEFYGNFGIIGGGIHVTRIGINKFTELCAENDSVAVSSIEGGVPLFYDSRLLTSIKDTGIKKKNPRNVRWEEKYFGGSCCEKIILLGYVK